MHHRYFLLEYLCDVHCLVYIYWNIYKLIIQVITILLIPYTWIKALCFVTSHSLLWLEKTVNKHMI